MIRAYKETDLDNLMNIWQQASALAHPFLDVSFVENITKAMREIYIPNPDAKTYVYEKNDKIFGFISMLENEVAGLFVSPKYHSKGIGSALVNSVKDNHINLEVEVFKNNKIGRAFYDKYGFKKTKEFLFEPANQVVLRMRFSK